MKLNDITIKVHHFGLLEDVSFKLAPMMIFTGQSNLGKSYANYLVYYFMSSVCNGGLLDIVKDESEIDKEGRQYVFDLDEFLKIVSDRAQEFMHKFLGDFNLECKVEYEVLKRNRKGAIEVRRDREQIGEPRIDEESGLLHTPQAYFIGFDGGKPRMAPNFNYVKYYVERYLQEFILGIYVSRAVILPPGRGAFAGENYTMKNAVGSSMNMYNYYFRDYDNGMNSRVRFGDDENLHLHERLLNMTSGGELLSVEDKQYLQVSGTDRIALSAGASSVKDLAPWMFYLKNYWVQTCSFCMEEPEAHQHPSVTVQIADVMATAMHQGGENLFHLTTHSDYLIQRLNQLVKLGYIRREDKNRFEQICGERGLDRNCYLDAEDIHAYYFHRDKKGRTVVERLDVTDEGIPMNTFFDVVHDLENREEYIDDAIYRMGKGAESHD